MTDEEERQLDAAIVAATGSRKPHLGGGFDPKGRVAWLEEEGGSFYLHTAGAGVPDVHREIETYNPFFGCTVAFCGWFGDEVVSIYREKHRTIVWAVPVFEPDKQRLTDIEDNAIVDGDTAFFEGDEPGLIEAIALPSFEPRSPIPFDGNLRWTELEQRGGAISMSTWERETSEWVPRCELRLPSPAQRGFADASLCGRIERALSTPDAPHPSASLLVGCSAGAFWKRRFPVYTTYHGKPGQTGEPPHWLPVYWYEHLNASGRDAEARELLAFLDAVAAPIAGKPERGWDASRTFEDGVLALATRHVRRRAAILAASCRSGRIPEHQFCYLFGAYDGDKPRALDTVELPRSVAAVHEQLLASPTKPASLSRRKS